MNEIKKKVIALGFFDGIHRGHQQLLRMAVERAKELDMTPAVFTFDRSPREFVTGVPVPLLSTAFERRLISRMIFGIDDVIIETFDHRMMTMPWKDFLQMLADKYNAGWLVAGHDFRCGFKNEGTALMLQEQAAQMGIGFDIIPAYKIDDIIVSSTHIRGLLLQGKVEEAAKFLGYTFTIAGVVTHGKGLGSRMGTPTVNLLPRGGRIVPAHGVYITRLRVDGKIYPSITNIGRRPTVDTNGHVTIECHALDRELRAYGKICRVEFLKMLRPEEKFSDLEALKAQIAVDMQQARDYFADVPPFDEHIIYL